MHKNNLVGVNYKVGREVMESVPYLARILYGNGVREFTEIADYLVINIAEEIDTAGIQNLYRKKEELEKLLKEL